MNDVGTEEGRWRAFTVAAVQLLDCATVAELELLLELVAAYLRGHQREDKEKT